MRKAVLERNRRSRELSLIMGKRVRYSFNGKAVVYQITLDIDKVNMDREEKILGDKYVWYDVYYYGTSYILIHDNYTELKYIVHPVLIDYEIIAMLIHDLITTGSNIMFILDTNDNNVSMKDLIIGLDKKYSILYDMSRFCVIRRTRGKYPPLQDITYRVESDIYLFRYLAYYHSGQTLEELLDLPGLRRLCKILFKYVEMIR